ncbi:MAG: hypothetical protein ACLVAA_07160 [Ruthenibacterium sp.]
MLPPEAITYLDIPFFSGNILKIHHSDHGAVFFPDDEPKAVPQIIPNIRLRLFLLFQKDVPKAPPYLLSLITHAKRTRQLFCIGGQQNKLFRHKGSSFSLSVLISIFIFQVLFFAYHSINLSEGLTRYRHLPFSMSGWRYYTILCAGMAMEHFHV